MGISIETDEIVCTQVAAQQAGVSVTYFRQLANQTPEVKPSRLRGTKVLIWTPAQVREVAGRKKR